MAHEAAVVKAQCNATKLACPDWQACFTSDAFDEKLAEKLLVGKQPAVLKAHGDLLNLLTALNAAAKVMSISPRVQIHDTTAECVSVALHTLASARHASTVIRGVELLLHHRHASSGPAEAAKFLKESPKEERAPIGLAFWNLFEVLAHDAAAAQSMKVGHGLSAVPGVAVKQAPPASEAETDERPGVNDALGGMRAGTKTPAPSEGSGPRLKRRRQV